MFLSYHIIVSIRKCLEFLTFYYCFLESFLLKVLKCWNFYVTQWFLKSLNFSQKNTFLINLSNLLYISLPIFRSNGCNHFRKIYTCIGRDSPRNVVKEWTLESAPWILPVLSDNFTLQYLWTTDLASKKYRGLIVVTLHTRNLRKLSNYLVRK